MVVLKSNVQSFLMTKRIYWALAWIPGELIVNQCANTFAFYNTNLQKSTYSNTKPTLFHKAGMILCLVTN